MSYDPIFLMGYIWMCTYVYILHVYRERHANFGDPWGALGCGEGKRLLF